MTPFNHKKRHKTSILGQIHIAHIDMGPFTE